MTTSNNFWRDRDLDRQHTLDVWIRALKIAAIGLGVWAALWLLGGDRDPEAKQMPQPESSMGRTAEIPPAVAMTGSSYTSVVGLKQLGYLTKDSDIIFYELSFNDSKGTRAVISIDDDLLMAQWLYQHQLTRVTLTLRAEDKASREGQE